MRVARDYLGDEGPLTWDMVTWWLHLDRFDQKYGKAFTGNPFFGANIARHVVIVYTTADRPVGVS